MLFRAFPVSVVIDGTLREPVLLWATTDRTEVWGVEGGRTPVLLATYAPVTARERAKGMFLEGNRKVRFVAKLADGTEIPVGQAPGCGCGHPLKSFQPAEAARA